MPRTSLAACGGCPGPLLIRAFPTGCCWKSDRTVTWPGFAARASSERTCRLEPSLPLNRTISWEDPLQTGGDALCARSRPEGGLQNFEGECPRPSPKQRGAGPGLSSPFSLSLVRPLMAPGVSPLSYQPFE